LGKAYKLNYWSEAFKQLSDTIFFKRETNFFKISSRCGRKWPTRKQW